MSDELAARAAREAAWLRARAFELTDRAAEWEALAHPGGQVHEISLPGAPADTVELVTDEAPLKLALIVGHQATMPGAYALHPIDMHEYEWADILALEIATTAHEAGVAVRIFKRDVGGIRGAYQRVRDWGASAAIELHFNSFGKASATGTETLTLVDVPGEQAFAKAVHTAMLTTLNLSDRGIKEPHPTRGAVALNQLSVPHILIEPFFGSNPDDVARAYERQDKMAVAIGFAASEFVKGQAA